MHPDTGMTTIFIYDGYPGGAGIAERGPAADRWLRATLEAIRQCPCSRGMPLVRAVAEMRQRQRAPRQDRGGVAARRDPRRAMGLTVPDEGQPASRICRIAPEGNPGVASVSELSTVLPPRRSRSTVGGSGVGRRWHRGCPSSPSRPSPGVPDRVPATSSCSATGGLAGKPGSHLGPTGLAVAAALAWSAAFAWSRGHRLERRMAAELDGRRDLPQATTSPPRRDELAARRARRATHPAN